MAQRSLNMASDAPKTRIESKYKFEYKYGLKSDLRAPNFKKKFWGSMPPDPPSACSRTHHHQCPPNRKYLPPPMSWTGQWLHYLAAVLSIVSIRYLIKGAPVSLPLPLLPPPMTYKNYLTVRFSEVMGFTNKILFFFSAATSHDGLGHIIHCS